MLAALGVIRVSGDEHNLGTIIAANIAVCNIFGYSRTELEGRNVSTLIPPPWASMHDTWLAAFTAGTVKSNMLNRTRRMFAMHRNGTLVPVAITLKQVSGGLDGNVFLAMVTPEKLSEREHFFVVDARHDPIIMKTSPGGLPLLGRLLVCHRQL